MELDYQRIFSYQHFRGEKLGNTDDDFYKKIAGTEILIYEE